MTVATGTHPLPSDRGADAGVCLGSFNPIYLQSGLEPHKVRQLRAPAIVSDSAPGLQSIYTGVHLQLLLHCLCMHAAVLLHPTHLLGSQIAECIRFCQLQSVALWSTKINSWLAVYSLWGTYSTE